MIVISDTTTVNYLVLCDVVDLLPRLFGDVVIPDAVLRELQHPAAPDPVQRFAAELPTWVAVRSVSAPTSVRKLGPGETEAIALALELSADLLLTDDKRARREAEAQQISCTGTLGVVEQAAAFGLIDFDVVVGRLRRTSLRLPPDQR